MASFTTKTMQTPEPAWWQPIAKWIADNIVIFMAFALGWKTIDRVFKYFSESRDAELKKIVQEEIKPIKEGMDELREAFYSIKIHK